MKEKTIVLSDGNVRSYDDLYDQINKLKEGGLSDKNIAKYLKVSKVSIVSEIYEEGKRLEWEKYSKVGGSQLKGEILSILQKLRTEAIQMLTQTKSKRNTALYVTILKTVKEMVAQEIKFMMDMNLLKPEKDYLSETVKSYEKLGMNELLTELENTKLEVAGLYDKVNNKPVINKSVIIKDNPIVEKTVEEDFSIMINDEKKEFSDVVDINSLYLNNIESESSFDYKLEDEFENTKYKNKVKIAEEARSANKIKNDKEKIEEIEQWVDLLNAGDGV